MAERINAALPEDVRDKVQIIHSRVRNLEEGKKRILVLHDLAQDPEVQHLRNEGWKKFDVLVFVSHWQQAMYNAYLGIPYSAGVVLQNAIEPIPEHKKDYDKTRLIYFSTPHRGLNILYAAFNQLDKEMPGKLELNVYSSFNLYGWPERDKPYAELFQLLMKHPSINYNKSVSNDEIREALKKSHILAYPSTWQETSCLCLIEAMSAGLLCVHSSLAALPETSLGLTSMYQYTEDQDAHAYRFYMALREAVAFNQDENIREQLELKLANDKFLADQHYNIEVRSIQWQKMMQNLFVET